MAAADHTIGPWIEALLITTIGFTTAVLTIFLSRLDITAAFGRFEVRLVALATNLFASIVNSLRSCYTGQALANAIEAYEQRYSSRGGAPPPAPQAAVPGVASGAEVEMQQMC